PEVLCYFLRLTRPTSNNPPVNNSANGDNAPPPVEPPDVEPLELQELLDELEELDELLLLDELLDDELLLDDDEELTPAFTKIPLKVPLSVCVETVIVRLPSDTLAVAGGGV